MTEMLIKIDDVTEEVDDAFDGGYLPMLQLDGGEDWFVAEDSEEAGKAARKRYAEMVEDDPEEFRCIIGDETLIKWCLGQYAGPGSTQYRSLQEWLDAWLDIPEEEFASYDGEEKEAKINEALAEELGFVFDDPDDTGWMTVVAYRHN